MRTAGIPYVYGGSVRYGISKKLPRMRELSLATGGGVADTARLADGDARRNVRGSAEDQDRIRLIIGADLATRRPPEPTTRPPAPERGTLGT
jgi:hypothetical protein